LLASGCRIASKYFPAANRFVFKMQSAATTVDVLSAPSVRWAWRLMPCLTDLAFLLPAAFLFAKLDGTQTLFADGDTGWHIRTGEWILAHGTVPTKDLFSFTKPDQPWFAWEWLWDVLFALIHSTFGLAGVAFATVMLLGVIAVLLYKLVLRACGNDVLSFFVTALALCGSSLHWLARPHLFSWLFFLGFLHLMPALQKGSTAAFIALPVLMVLWVNMHGAFFIGIALLLAAACGEALEALLPRGESLATAFSRCRPLLGCAACCLAATFVNPYTWRLHRHIFEFLSDKKLLDIIQEYQSISFHCPPAIFFELMIFLAAAAAFWHLQAGRITPALLTVMWIHLALLSGRNIPLFMIIAAPVVAPLLQHLLSGLRPLRYLGVVLTTVSEICEELKPLERAPRAYLLSGLGTLALAGLFANGAKGFEAQFKPESFPVQAIPLVERSAAKRIFTYDQWGDYLIYRLYPKKRVFVDGRSDFFGMPIFEDMQHILNAQYDWNTQLRHYAIDMVLVRPDAPICAVLKISPNWTIRFDDGKVMIFEAASLKHPIPPEASGAETVSPIHSVLERRKHHD
jgi:hypothetical protein